MPSGCFPVAAAIFLPNLGGHLGYIPVRRNLSPWYAELKKPHWGPPNWVFAPVWTSLYSGMGLASYIVWKHGGGCHGPAKIPLMAYASQLALNWAWTPIFFGAHKIKLAFYELLALDGAAAVTAYLFYKIHPRAGILFVPYLMWLSYATVLTYVVQRDNPDSGATVTEVE